ncbi:amidase [Enterobacter sp. CC120223-11]|uniref:amidase n=1 Tax=Enterobacter sp. CC120223-11 TaxID=1378073 RepID=UPI000BE3464B|nr:amidase [Enterobacter sp. CC120223-11]
MKPVSVSKGFVAQFIIGEGDLRFAVKDTLDVAGFQTQAGSPALASVPVATQSASVVQTLLEKGCALVGKTALHELAFGVTGINPWGGTPLNTLFPALIPGGSSSGSAAVVASGEADFSIGTDTGGSVRMPAACCGVYGLKPGYGVLSRKGVLPAESSLDCVGVFTRDADTLCKVMTRLGVPVDEPLTSLPQISFLSAAAAEIDSHLLAFLSGCGLELRQAELPSFADAHRAGLAIISHENWLAFGPLLAGGKVSADVATRIRAGADVSEQTLKEAEQVRTQFTREVDELLAQTPLLALATLPDLPPTLAEASDPLSVVNLTRLVRPFNLSGHPALAIPVGELHGRPVSLQLVAAKGHEGLLVQAAKWLEQRRRH